MVSKPLNSHESFRSCDITFIPLAKAISLHHHQKKENSQKSSQYRSNNHHHQYWEHPRSIHMCEIQISVLPLVQLSKVISIWFYFVGLVLRFSSSTQREERTWWVWCFVGPWKKKKTMLAKIWSTKIAACTFAFKNK